MQLAPVSRKDLEPLAELIRASVPELSRVDAQALETQTFGDSDHDISFLLQAVDRGKPVGVALGVARPGPQGKEGWFKVFAVKDSRRGKGVGTALFSELERRFRKRGVSLLHTGRCPAPMLVNGVSAEDTQTVSFLMRRGYQPVKTVINMTADLVSFEAGWTDKDKEVLKAAKVRVAKEGDLRYVQDLVSAEFSGWAWEVKNAVTKGTLFIASEGKKIIGFSACDASAPGWFGPMGCAAAHRGKGLGRALFLKALERMKENGAASALVPDVGPVPFYRKQAGARLGPLAFDLAKRV